IPARVASGMLAGIVVTFAINAVKAIPADPRLILPLIAAFFIIRLFNPSLSVLAVLVGGGLAAFAWFMFVQPDLTWRVLAMNFGFGGLSLLVAAELRTVRNNGPTEKILFILA
ncbi:benzoate/H(+) symporter BenE family transporter, partial [Mesorhizobium sp. M2E.F.Ca.ET.209.01.1.1]|uniref:benzoate/H(+) symporter BenE family transporter n=1 Tax=Mesorhizobium sp. M2E.F.Ca.ET.209.01.1.1 TaxID=2500526 RepID=UPI001FEFC47E